MNKPTVTHGTCPHCGHNECYSEWEDGNFLCHSCGAKPSTHSSKSEKKEIAERKVIPYRNLTKKAVEVYDIETGLDEDGKEISRHYKYPHKEKTRVLPKDFSQNIGFKNDHLFGMDKFTSGASDSVTIVEGEDDTPAAWQILGGQQHVVSIPGASISSALLKNCYKWLDGYKTIIVATDSDQAGEAAADKLAATFPGKVYRVHLSKFKDAMEYLENGASADFKSAWLNKSKYVPAFDISTPDGFIKLLHDEDDDSYVPSGIDAFDENHLGLFQGHVTLFQAPEGTGKCLHPEQGVLLHNGSVRAAKDIKVGDHLMGLNSTVRTVQSVCEGTEMMYKVTPTKGDPWICNESHILSLVHSVSGEVTNISVKDYLTTGPDFKKHHLQYRTPVSSFSGVEIPQFDPYVVGVYLGDGHTHRCAMSMGTKKTSILEYTNKYFSSLGYTTKEVPSTGCTELQVSKNWERDAFWSYIKGYLTPRSIPSNIKTGSWETRKAVLSGLLDTDGSVVTGSGVEITQKSETLADDIVFVSRSLGLAAYKKSKSVGKDVYYRVHISGDLKGTLNTLRLKFSERKQKKDVLRTGFTVEPVGEGKYNGFTLDGDRLFLLDDFTVTHNTELFHFFEHHFIKNYPEVPFASCHLEESEKRTLLSWVSYELDKNVTRKDLIDDVPLVEKTIRELTKHENAHLFAINTDEDPLVLLDRIKYYTEVFGCKYFFIEPIQDLAQQGHNEASDERFLSKIAVNLARIAKEKKIGIILIGHENDEGLISDCRKLSKQASVVVKLERDIENADPDIRNITTLKSKKNRPSSYVGYAGQLKFNPKTFKLTEYYS